MTSEKDITKIKKVNVFTETLIRSHAFKLVAKYSEDWMKNLFFRREKLYMAQKTPQLPRQCIVHRKVALHGVLCLPVPVCLYRHRL